MFPSEEAFTSLGLNWDMIRTVPTGTVARLRNCPSDGSLVKEPNSPEVYLAVGDVLRWVSNETRFGELGLDWNAVRTVPAGSLGRIKRGSTL